MKNPTTKIATGEFFGETIEYAIGPNGARLIGMSRICDSLGISFASQRKKISAYAWGRRVVMITTRDSKGRRQDQLMMDIRSFPMWLSTIHPGKVNFSARVKLEAFQLELIEVVETWFDGGLEGRGQRMVDLDKRLSPNPEITAMRTELAVVTTELSGVRSELAVIKKQSKRVEGIATIAKKRVDAQGKLIEAILHPYRASPVESMTVRQARDEWQILGSDGRLMPNRELSYVGKAVAALCRATGQSFDRVDDGKRTVGSYPVGVLAAWKADHDLRCRVTKETYSKFTQLRLYDKLG